MCRALARVAPAVYAQGLDEKNDEGYADVNDIFKSMGGDPRAGNSRVKADYVHDYLLEEFELDVDIEEAFALHGGKDISKPDFEGLLMAKTKA